MDRPRQQLNRYWPAPPLGVALVEPQIPPNTGAIARLCAATSTNLHLVEPLGFRLTNHQLKRAGLDYWESVEMHRYHDLEEFTAKSAAKRKFYFSTTAKKSYTDIEYEPGDILVFGSETKGLPSRLLDCEEDNVYGIPIRLDHVRSLNLATSTSIVSVVQIGQAAVQLYRHTAICRLGDLGRNGGATRVRSRNSVRNPG